jgi:hypothetical protein
MNCRDFERCWNERLDARSAAPAGLDRAMEAHAADCPSCRALGARYQALAQALLAAGPSPAPPPGFADRVLAAAVAEAGRGRLLALRLIRRLAPMAAAAVVLAAGAVLLQGWARDRAAPAPVARARPIDPDGLTEALALASSATWALAREASAPAARVGRQVLEPAEPAETTPELLAMPVEVPLAAEVLQSVGDRVNAGVRPLEGTARHAFGFLLGAAPDDDRPPPRPAEGA